MPQFAITTGIMPHAQKIVLYGVEGIGKTTFASQFPNAVFIDTEGGSKYLNVARFDAPQSWNMLLEEIDYAKSACAPGTTLVIDTLDWAERLCVEHLLSANKWQSIESPGYGKGYVQLAEQFAKLLDKLSEVAAGGITVLGIAHAQISKFEQPDDAAPYDRWCMKLTRKTEPLVKEWADALLFANYKSMLQNTNDGKAKAVGMKRVLYCNHAPAIDAKNRWGLPDVVPFEFSSISQHLGTFDPSQPVVSPVVPALQKPVPLPVPAQQSPVPLPMQASNNKIPADVIPPKNQAPAIPDAAPKIPPSKAPVSAPLYSPDPEKLLALRQLMEAAGISDALMQETVASQGYIPKEAPLEVYPPELLGRLITNWEAVKGVAESLSIPVPFS